MVLPWRRFAWDLSKERASAFLFDGYRSAMTVGHERAFGLVPVEELEQTRCVVLLGESGLGKTRALAELCNQQNERAPGSGKRVNLASAHGPADLKALLEGTGYPWESNEPPTLYLDAFERSPCPALGSVLGTMLAESRPRLRLAAQPGAWGQEHRKALQEVYGDDLREYELSLLSRQDVRLAAERYGLDPGEVLPELDTAGAGPLLARPLTCRMILELAAARDLPQPLTRETLYRAGLERLLKGAIDDGKLRSPSVARLIAERLALATVFGGQEHFPCELGASVLDQLITQEREPLGGGSFHPQVISEELRAVLLHSGLFTAIAGFTHWAHASFAEYLAAEYLRRHEVTGARLRSLLGMVKDGEVPTALEGVLGWLAPRVPDLWREVVSKHPVQCLHADPMALSHAQRAELVEAIFDGLANHTIGSLTLPTDRLSALAHPGLAEQVRARLPQTTYSDVVYVALQVVRSCKLLELVEAVVAMALSQEVPLWVRVSAGDAVCELGTKEQKRRLAPLLEGDVQDEKHDLFGVALRALWPDQLTAEELFSKLAARPPVVGFGSMYIGFLYELRSQLAEPNVLAVALEWAGKPPVSSLHCWKFMVNAVIETAIQAKDRNRYIVSLVDIILSRIMAGRHLLADGENESVGWDDDIRREVLRELLRRGNSVNGVLRRARWSRPPLFNAKRDVTWMQQELASLQQIPEGWCELLSSNDILQHESSFDAVFEFADRWPRLRTALGSILEVALHGEAAERARRQHRIDEENDLIRRQDISSLEAFASGEVQSAEWVLYNYKEERQGAPARCEIERAAVDAVVNGNLNCEVSIEAVVWALGLARDQGRLHEVPAAVCRELAGMLFHQFCTWDMVSLGRVLWSHSSTQMLMGIRTAPLASIRVGLSRYLALFPSQWSPELIDGWMIRAREVPVATGRCILEAIAMRSEKSAWLGRARHLDMSVDVQERRSVQSLLYLFGEREDRQRAASGLFSAKRRVSMEIIEELGETWERLSKRCRTSLEPDELASLALRVTGDSNAEQELREQALEHLFAADGPGADAALDRVRQGFPTSGWLQHRVHVAKRRLATSYWAPMELSQLFAFVRRRDLRIVRTQQDLFDLAGEGLNAFQEELWEHADRLWNTDGKPKPEETLSKELEVFFRGYLSSQRVISVREPELRRVAHGMGPRVDVYVAVYPEQGRVDASQRLEVLLEVKRCVHQRWDQPESELKERYLSPGRRHGWYVVGRYDDGCAACNKMGLEGMQAHLDRKVALLTQSVVVRAKALDCSWAAAADAKSRKRATAAAGGAKATGTEPVAESVSKRGGGAQMSSTQRGRRAKGPRG